jgi:hypothetical protein
MDTGALETIAATEGMGVVRLLLHIAGLRLEVSGLKREVQELKARLKALVPHEVP